MSDALFDAATDFLDNGGDLPSGLRAEQRFRFTSALIKQVHEETKANKRELEEVETDFREHLKEAEGQWKELKARLNVIGGSAIIASAIIAALSALGVI